MSVSPRKKKIVKILIITAPRLSVAYDNDEEGTIWEIVGVQMSHVTPLTFIGSPSTREEDALVAMEDLCTVLENENTYIDEPTFISAVEDASGALQVALDNL